MPLVRPDFSTLFLFPALDIVTPLINRCPRTSLLSHCIAVLCTSFLMDSWCLSPLFSWLIIVTHYLVSSLSRVSDPYCIWATHRILRTHRVWRAQRLRCAHLIWCALLLLCAHLIWHLDGPMPPVGVLIVLVVLIVRSVNLVWRISSFSPWFSHFPVDFLAISLVFSMTHRFSH